MPMAADPTALLFLSTFPQCFVLPAYEVLLADILGGIGMPGQKSPTCPAARRSWDHGNSKRIGHSQLHAEQKSHHRSTPVIVTKFAHRQCWPTVHRGVDCLYTSVAGLKTSLRTTVARQPSGAVSLQESCDFPLGKIGPVHVRIAFRNALLIGKRHQVKISPFGVNDAHRSVVPQTSLNNCAIQIFDPLTVVPEPC